jgi:molybdenum cofactor biosynthesis enzyme MoaA
MSPSMDPAHIPAGRPALADAFGRTITYPRLSVTARCDLRCTCCLPKGFKGCKEPEHWLSFPDIERIVGAFVRLGVRRVRITGGEPSLPRDLPELVRRPSALPGLQDLRVRLGLDGALYPCLSQEERFDLRPLLRDGASEAELEAAIHGAIARKPERHEFREAPQKILRFMSATGV